VRQLCADNSASNNFANGTYITPCAFLLSVDMTRSFNESYNTFPLRMKPRSGTLNARSRRQCLL